ncbi:hypothetical protein VYU27_003559 [Nannochloropsis oceanica]
MRIVCQNLQHPYARVAVRIMEGRILDFDFDGHTSIINTGFKDKEGPRHHQRSASEVVSVQPACSAPFLGGGGGGERIGAAYKHAL